MRKGTSKAWNLGSFAVVASLLLMTPLAAVAAPACPADIGGDSTVGVADLTYLLAAWGTADPAADFNSDGLVGCFDQEYLLGNWGPCPSCSGDVDGNGTVNTSDLNLVLSTWGTDCRIDLNENGLVDSNDVDALLCLWGSSDPSGDFDGNGTVGVSDLNHLLASFSNDCRGDLDRDGAVGNADLNLVLDNWGRCSK
ncbi:MAG: hypothetical protein K0U98_23375 [Deltaproteobacteria bacterium]|nr:hypothetical protein [Deltaproteobacteria bacterium]